MYCHSHPNSYHSGRTFALLAIVLLSLVLFIYSGMRAYYVSFTHDESATFIYGVIPGLKNLIIFNFVDANNHLLNTFLMILSHKLFGHSEIALRLPNLIAYIFYLLFSALLALKCSKPAAIVSSFLILNVNPFLLHYFSQARGYGLAAAFLLGSVYFMDAFILSRGQSRWAGILSLFMAACSVLANLTFLYFYIMMTLILLLMEVYYVKNEKSPKTPLFRMIRSWWHLIKYIIINLVCLALIIIPIFIKLQIHEKFSWGGSIGFWHDTVLSLIRASLDNCFYSKTALLFVSCLVIITITACIIVSVIMISRKHYEVLYLGFLASVVILLGSSFGIILAHHLLSIKYLYWRTGIFLIPLFLSSIVYFVRVCELNPSLVIRQSIYMTICIITVFLVVHLICVTNLSYVYPRNCEADTKQMLHDLTIMVQNEVPKDKPIHLGIDWEFEPIINYYRRFRFKDDLTWLAPVDRTGYAGNHTFYYDYMQKRDILHQLTLRDYHDYLFIHRKNLELVRKVSPVQELKEYPLSNTVLVRQFR